MKHSLIVAFFVLLGTGCIADLSVDAPVEAGLCQAPASLEPLLEAFPPCDLGICGEGEADRMRGRCVDDTQLDADQIAMLTPCGTQHASHCVPVSLVLSQGQAKPPVCSSLNGAEGRCTSLCVPSVAAKASQLPRDVCAEDELCAPCFDPISGESTGACETNACDAPTEPPVVFERCCEGRAVCLPQTLVPESKRGSLDQQTCMREDDLCVPEENTDLAYQPPVCQTLINGEGRCLSTCIEITAIFQQRTCNRDQRCVPCSIAGVATGACD